MVKKEILVSKGEVNKLLMYRRVGMSISDSELRRATFNALNNGRLHDFISGMEEIGSKIECETYGKILIMYGYPTDGISLLKRSGVKELDKFCLAGATMALLNLLNVCDIGENVMEALRRRTFYTLTDKNVKILTSSLTKILSGSYTTGPPKYRYLSRVINGLKYGGKGELIKPLLYLLFKLSDSLEYEEFE